MDKVDFTTLGTASPDAPGAIQKRWWLSNKTDRAQAILSVVTAIGNNDSRRQNQYMVSSRLYGDVNIMGQGSTPLSRAAQALAPARDRITFNVVQSCIDTVTAKIAKNKPKPLFLTSGGDAQMQRKAKKLTKYVEGVFYENRAHDEGPMIFRDGAVVGDGFTHVFALNGRVKYQRVMAQELYTDWLESYYGRPRQLHRVTNMDREVLMEMFPEKEALLKRANSAQSEAVSDSQNVSDQIQVVESWHLRSGPDADDGMHCMVIPEGTLFEEEWPHDFFPFARFRWSPRLAGYFSQGAAEQVQSIQIEINKLLWIIQRSIHLGGTFKVLLENTSKIVKEHLNNDIGTIVTYTGVKPDYVTPPLVQPEIYAHLAALKAAAYERVGVSQLSAGSKKPDGLDSGKAMREYNNIESERFMTIGQAYEQYFMELAKISIAVSKQIAEEEGGYEVKYVGRNGIESIDWKDIELDEKDYVMKAYPVSSLPSDPAGRLMTIQEYMQAGLLSPRTGKKLLDFPDLEAVENRQNAVEEWVDWIFDRILDEGVYTPPEPTDNLALMKEMALEYYAQAKCQQVEEDKLQMIRNFLTQVDVLLGTAAMGAEQSAMAMAPQAAPTATPQSDLIPNVANGAMS